MNLPNKLMLSRFALTAAFLAVLAGFAVEARAAAALEISGIILAKTCRDSTILRTDSNWFVVTLDGTSSRIKAGPMGNPAIIDFEYGLLDQDSYLLIRHATNLPITEAYTVMDGVATKTKLAGPMKAENDAEMYINAGHKPEYMFSMFATPFWLAYCFQLDQTNPTTKHARSTPIFSMGAGFREKGGLADLTYTLNSQPPNFLESLIETGDSRQFEALKLPAPAKGVFTNGIFQALSWTNAGGLTVTRQFQAANTLVVDPLGAVVKGLKIVYEGTATNIVVNAARPPAFSIPAATRVVEQRSAVVAPLASFAYLTTNGTVMSREQLLQDEDFRLEVSEAPERSTPRSPVKK